MARYGTVKNQMGRVASTALQQPEEIRERRSSAEDVLGALESRIGAPGTYDLPTAPTGPIAESPPEEPIAETGLLSRDGFKFGSESHVRKYEKFLASGNSPEEAAAKAGGEKTLYQDGGIFKQQKTATGRADPNAATQGLTSTVVLDKDKALAQMESSSAFRQVSRMMAESEQMLARSGPLYDEMMRSTQLPILEGSATLARENTEAIRKALQRGGAARRDGFAAIAKIRAQEQANATRGQALAKAHIEMDRWIRQNASETITFAHGWATNQAGIRESYHSAMDAASQLMTQSALPMAFNSYIKQQEYRDAQSAQSRGKVMKQISAVLGVATSVVGLVGSFYGQGGGSTAGAEMMKDSMESPKISNNYMTAATSSTKGLPTQADPEYS